MSKKVYKETYFPHDRYARRDTKIKNLLVHFRRESEIKAQAAVCIYWWIVEDMHTDDYPVNKLEAFADDYRCDVEFLRSILEDFELFRIEDGCYISDRVLRNIKEQEEKSEKARQKAQQRWNNKKKNEDAPDGKDIADEVIELFNTEFKKELTVSKENRKKINEITKDNNLTSEDWQKIIKNAKRGWDIEGKNKKPMFKNILKDWDSFKSDDYNLAPDYEAQEAEKEAKRQAAEQRKAEEKEAKRLEDLETVRQQQQKKEDYEAITDKESALEFLFKYIPEAMQKNTDLMRISTDFRTTASRFDISAQEVKDYYYSKQPKKIGL